MHEKPLLNMYQASSEPRSDKEKKFQNNHEALAGVPQAEIDQYKVDKASCWRCRHNSHHTLECFAKKTSKGTELATMVAAVSKRTKHQWPSEDSEDEDEEPTKLVSKRTKKVAAVTQTISELSPEISTRVWEVETSDLSDLN
jgi:hypothetical protein